MNDYTWIIWELNGAYYDNIMNNHIDYNNASDDESCDGLFDQILMNLGI